MNELLAMKLRPKSLDEIVGQRHLIGENKVITNLVNNKKIFSMILYGPPGTGKTSIAISIVNELDVKYRMLNAVINNKKDFDIVIEEAKMYKAVMFIAAAGFSGLMSLGAQAASQLAESPGPVGSAGTVRSPQQ